VVQAAQDGHRERLTDGLDGARNRRVHLQRQMRAGLVVIFLILFEQMTQMPLAKYNHMVKAIPRPDQPLRTSVLPW
jgi:hypothetical protein